MPRVPTNPADHPRGRGPLGALPGLSPSARRALILGGVLAVLTAGALVVQAWALATVLAEVAAGAGASVGWLIAVGGAVAVRSLLGWATRVVAARAAAGAKAELRAVLLDRSLAGGPEWIGRRGAAELTALATRGLDALDAYFGTFLPALVTAMATPLGVGAVILFVDWPSAVVVALTVPLIPLFAILIGKHTADRVGESAEVSERLSGRLLELVRALPVLAAFGRDRAQERTVREVSEGHRRTTVGVLRVAFSSALALELVATLSVALVAVVIGLRMLSGDLTLLVGLFVLIVVPECYLPLRAAGAAYHASEDGLEAVRRVAALPPVPPSGTVPVEGFDTVRVEGVGVRRRDGWAPDGISLVLRPGSVVRLDSPSGSGKSTLFGVLLGFVAPDRGRVLVDGVPLSDIDMSTWRRLVAWVPQRPVFAAEVVADEVGPLPRGELAAVARTVAAEHLLDRRVDSLSAGERQRVAVLRALVRRDVRLLLLDEPTAHLDSATAALVMRAVSRLASRGVAVCIASHVSVVGSGDVPAASTVEEAVAEAEAPGRLRELISRRTLGGALLGAVALACGVALTALSAWLIARASQQPALLVLSVAIVGVRTFGLARAGLRYLERLVSHDAAFRDATRLRGELWSALVRRGPARAPRAGEGLRRLVDDVDTVRDLTPRVLAPPVVALGVALAAVAVQTAMAPSAGLVLAAALVVACVLAPLVTLAAERRASAALAEGARTVADRVFALLAGAADLVAFGRDTGRRAELARLDASLTARARRQAFGAGLGEALITLVLGLAAVLSVPLAAGVLDPVLVPIVALVPLAVAEAVIPLTGAMTHLGPLRAAYGRISALRADRGTVVAPPQLCTGVRLVAPELRWPGASAPALRDVDLRITPGSFVAVVGPSGSGKSTLLAAVLGFLPVPVLARPSAVAWAPQDPMLVSTTVRENLRLADPHADDGRLAAALARAGLPGFDLDAQATAVSGGEAQRIAIARALLADADVVLLDEPTAHLDEPTADAVLADLRAALADSIVVHVTHRPAEAAAADVVIEVVDGRARMLSRV
ncbi:thiol reductant ABC exporter subunit CydC [Actinokineospora fastidiosa]|uniref:Thiol reductant ABC exporter subunit CydC n=1 Tax=Actinokineospora fastidiosa TaxID=1816 RepID=A0A918G4W0_9PSEU|nr:thiol reductant ABC exporter subunit CydC [Actinokineospora fastidiosa]